MAMPNAVSPTDPSRGRVRKLFDEAWQRARARRRRLLEVGILAALVIAGAAVVAHNPRPRATGIPGVSHLPSQLRFAASVTGKHDHVIVTITARHATGVFGKVRRSYYLAAQRVQPQIDCVNNRSSGFPDSSAGNSVQAALDPADGDGGPEGWCPGLYRGTVTYTVGFACPAQGACHPPTGFPHRSTIVARFSYRVG